MILPFILHHANRSKDQHFYTIKTTVLKKHAKEDGYDIQHIPGKECYACGGTGIHHRDQDGCPEQCWQCIRGWFKLPQWICLQRYQYGPYIFHTPLKREFKVKNPWVADEMGWEVSNRPVMEGYVEHEKSRYTNLCLRLLLWRYDTGHAVKLLKWDIEKWWYRVKSIKFNFREEEGLPF